MLLFQSFCENLILLQYDMFEGSKLQEVGIVGYVVTFTVSFTAGVHADVATLLQIYNLEI